MKHPIDTRSAESAKIPIDRFRELHSASDDILQSIFERARFDFGRNRNRIDTDVSDTDRDALDTVAEQVRLFFRAESCGIFLINWTDPNRAASTADKIDWANPYGVSLVGTSNEVEHTYERFIRPFHATSPTRFTVMLAHRVREQQAPCIMGEDELLALNRGGNHNFAHLRDRRCFSLMASPLFDRKHHFIGFIKVENKRESGQESNFSHSIDTELMLSLSKKIETVIEVRQFLDSLRAIMSADHTRVLKVILEQAVQLLRGDRADFTVGKHAGNNGNHGGGLQYETFLGHYESVVEGGDVPPGFIVDTWEDNHEVTQDPTVWRARSNSRWTGDVRAYERLGGHYQQVSPGTISEIAVRFGPEDNCLGVLNVESFKANHFDERDEEILQIMAKHAANAVQIILARKEEAATTQLYIQLVNGFPNMMIIQKNKASQIVFSNKAFQQHVKMTGTEILHQGCDDFTFFSQERAEEYQRNDRQVMEHDEACQMIESAGFKIFYQTWNGELHMLKGERPEERYMDVTKIRMTNAKGEPEGVQCIFSDVTERVRKEKHRLRELHHRVSNNLEIILARIDRKADVKGIVKALYSLHRRMYPHDEPGEIRINEYIDELASILYDLYKSENVKIERQLREPVHISLSWNKAQAIPIIIVELITNALKHAFPDKAKEGKIFISLRSRMDHMVELVISDNGVGFDKHHMQHQLGIELVEYWITDILDGQHQWGTTPGGGTTWKVVFRTR